MERRERGTKSGSIGEEKRVERGTGEEWGDNVL